MLITVCRLVLHDYLYYASREMGRLYETEKYLHNYGLTYALGLARAPFSNLVQTPRYREDLSEVNSARRGHLIARRSLGLDRLYVVRRPGRAGKGPHDKPCVLAGTGIRPADNF
jgi:hypothetical protein